VKEKKKKEKRKSYRRSRKREMGKREKKNVNNYNIEFSIRWYICIYT